MGEDRFHGSFQPYENLRTFLWRHADNMPGIGLDRFSIAAARIGQQVHGAGSKVTLQWYLRRATPAE